MLLRPHRLWQGSQATPKGSHVAPSVSRTRGHPATPQTISMDRQTAAPVRVEGAPGLRVHLLGVPARHVQVGDDPVQVVVLHVPSYSSDNPSSSYPLTQESDETDPTRWGLSCRTEAIVHIRTFS